MSIIRKISGYIFGAALIVSMIISSAVAASYSDSIENIPENTIFKFKQEFEVPANARFVELGRNGLDDFYNNMGQTLNQLDGQLYSDQYNPVDYFSSLGESVFQTYNDCIERHRSTYFYDTEPDTTITNQGDHNVNVVINNSAESQPEGPIVFTEINENACIKPTFTYSVLTINSKKSAQGGMFRNGYELKVKKVSARQYRNFNTVEIYFDHDVARSLLVITSYIPSEISISQLEEKAYQDEGFWNTVATGIGNMSSIAGNHFEISLPGVQYFD